MVTLLTRWLNHNLGHNEEGVPCQVLSTIQDLTITQPNFNLSSKGWRNLVRGMGEIQRATKALCPHHGLPKWCTIQNFYDGLNYNIKISLDAAANGAILSKNSDDAFNLIEDMACNLLENRGINTSYPHAAENL